MFQIVLYTHLQWVGCQLFGILLPDGPISSTHVTGAHAHIQHDRQGPNVNAALGKEHVFGLTSHHLPFAGGFRGVLADALIADALTGI